jgi:hypothetical protein
VPQVIHLALAHPLKMAKLTPLQQCLLACANVYQADH